MPPDEIRSFDGTELSSLRTLKIMPRNLNEIVPLRIRLQYRTEQLKKPLAPYSIPWNENTQRKPRFLLSYRLSPLSNTCQFIEEEHLLAHKKYLEKEEGVGYNCSSPLWTVSYSMNGFRSRTFTVDKHTCSVHAFPPTPVLCNKVVQYSCEQVSLIAKLMQRRYLAFKS